MRDYETWWNMMRDYERNYERWWNMMKDDERLWTMIKCDERWLQMMMKNDEKWWKNMKGQEKKPTTGHGKRLADTVLVQVQLISWLFEHSEHLEILNRVLRQNLCGKALHQNLMSWNNFLGLCLCDLLWLCCKLYLSQRTALRKPKAKVVFMPPKRKGKAWARPARLWFEARRIWSKNVAYCSVWSAMIFLTCVSTSCPCAAYWQPRTPNLSSCRVPGKCLSRNAARLFAQSSKSHHWAKTSEETDPEKRKML